MVSHESASLILHQGGRYWDAMAPHRELSSMEAVPGSGLLVTALDPPEILIRRTTEGGWRMRPEFFWSLVDPLNPQAVPLHESTESDTGPLRHLWRALAWWQALPMEERGSCATLLDRCVRGGHAALDILDRVAAAGSPFGASQATPDPSANEPTMVLDVPRDPAALAEFMIDPQGLGSLYGQQFIPRQEQADLTAAVMRHMDSDQALLAEAGTGTGKTLAYLAPLVARLSTGSGRAVISTYSRALQAQILDGDLPMLAAGRRHLMARLLMGRSNYVCLRQRRAYLTRPLEDTRDAAKTVAFRLWLQATTDGVRDELAEHPLLAEDLSVLFTGVQPCTPDCWEHEGCFVVRARRLAREARLVVVNHALLLSDQHAGGALIGPFDDLVVDEAHRLPQTMLDAASVRLDHYRLEDLEKLVGKHKTTGQIPEVPALLGVRLRAISGGERAADSAEAFGKAINRCLKAYASWWRDVGRELSGMAGAMPGQRRRVADKEVTFHPVDEATNLLLETAAEAATAGAVLNQRTDDLEDMSTGTVDLLAQCAKAGQLLRGLERDVRFVTTDPSDRWVTWLEPSRRAGVQALGATPLESGPLLKDIWLDNQRQPVATSATLAVDGDFGFMLNELGLTGRRPQTATTAVPSPFNWPEQALCLSAEDLPGPDSPDFPAAVAEILTGLRQVVGRQTLALFTAYRLLQDVAERVQADEEEASLFEEPLGDLLVQSPRSGPGELRDRFRRSRGAMLMGTSTFWEGVDFPGESLEILVVTKLPFLVPNDPWVEARCEHLKAAGENPFTSFMLRDAVLRLRQGVGRLIRRRSDRGVVLLLDNRLISRRYGTTFLSALPVPVRWLPSHRDLAAATAEFMNPS